MNEKQILYSNYEDALFSIIMNEAAESDGKRLIEENEELKKDTSAMVSNEFVKRCQNTISKEINRKKKSAARGTMKRMVRLVPMVVLVSVFLTAIAYAAIPTFRKATLKFLLEITPESMTWSFVDSENDHEIPAYEEYYCWMPAGFEKTESSNSQDMISDTYTDGNGNSILITIVKGENTIVQTDNEELDFYECYINENGNKVIFTQKNGTTSASWVFADVPCFINITASGNIKLETIKRISDTLLYPN